MNIAFAKNTPAKPARELLAPHEAADFLMASPNTLSTWRCRGRGPKFVKLGGRIFYRRADLDAFVEASVRDPAAA